MTFLKSINSKGNLPAYVQVSENDLGALQGNDGNWYCPKHIVEESYPKDTYALVFLPDSMFQPIPEPQGWDYDNYCQQLNEAHNELFTNYYTERDYLTIGEIPLWMDDKDYGTEALQLKQWWILTCKTVADFLETVNEETAIPVNDFIESLPKLTL